MSTTPNPKDRCIDDNPLAPPTSFAGLGYVPLPALDFRGLKPKLDPAFDDDSDPDDYKGMYVPWCPATEWFMQSPPYKVLLRDRLRCVVWNIWDRFMEITEQLVRWFFRRGH